MKYRFDLVLSYWIFAWFLLHMAGLIRASPKLALAVGLAANTVQWIMLVVYYGDAPMAMWFIFINIFIKVIPLYLVWRERIRWRQDLENLGILVAVYLLYCVAVGDNPVARFRNTLSHGFDNHDRDKIDAKKFPAMALFQDLFGHTK
jgi:hypothetical protein